MQGVGRRPAAGAGRHGLVGAALLALALGGCISGGSTVASTGRVTLIPIAFESITGAPQPVFNRLVDDLGREAESRRVLIVSRQDNASYRVKGYLSATNEGGQSRLAYVFDVFDAAKRRTLRISGEEPTLASGDPWTGASDSVIARVAAHGIGDLAAFLSARAPTETAEMTAAEGAPAGFAAAQ